MAFLGRRTAKAGAELGRKPGRTERTDDIRLALLVDRDESDNRRGLIDDAGFVSEHALAKLSGGSRPPVRDALAALVARRVLSAIPAKGYKVALLTKEVLEQNEKVGYNAINGIRAELARTANAAFESISTAPSTQDRQAVLSDANVQINKAAQKSDSDLVRDRGEAVFLATQTLGLIGSAAGFRWGSDTLRSALDILEISTRWNQDKKDRRVFEGLQVKNRITSCRELLTALTAQGTVVPQKAASIFSNYLDERITELENAIADQP
jgi:DNA-binding GntR family transcriptional regulator